MKVSKAAKPAAARGSSAPDLASSLRLAQAAMQQERYTECAQLLRDCRDPLAGQSNPFHRLLGEALRRSGQAQEAVGALMQALALRADDEQAFLQLAFAFQDLQMPQEAAECFRAVAALQPNSVMAQAYLAHGDQQALRWQDFEANQQSLLHAIRAKPADAADEFGVPFTLIGLPHQPADLLKVARLSSRYLTRGIRPLPPRQAKPLAAGRRLRIGYLSADFHDHATAALLVEVLEARDRQRFEVFLFSHGPDDGSAMRQRLRQACERFIDVAGLSLAAIAQRIRAEQIDIIIDLKGHTAQSRFAALAYRPAPVQVAWLGFPGSSGADFIDYIIGDPHVTPLDQASAYSEQIAQLPRCYQPNDSQRLRVGASALPSRAALGLPEHALVLLSAHPIYKVTPALFDAWMSILRRLPGAVLWQLSGGAALDAQLQREALTRGITPERLVFAPRLPMHEHLQRLATADLALDSWPCNGHTTTSDALAAGLPVLTLRGECFTQSVAASILVAAGLDELVCGSEQDYIDRACALGEQPEKLLEVRGRVLSGRQALFDAPRFARELESLLLRMWERAEAGLAPAALPAELPAELAPKVS
ncbi:O-linked N-acetylglucosamine transferase, SPINDLY family protein [Roseateles sp. PN1]|uniref:O-linked N-acetylglucosamine transferase, SPINDLY family protein n=1 Tax=Roseateles sp. PN1 TaxID=3137372 RepID=UPI003138A970